jgi:hypothetical protein
VSDRFPLRRVELFQEFVSCFFHRFQAVKKVCIAFAGPA